jgi:hypothetical protein
MFARQLLYPFSCCAADQFRSKARDTVPADTPANWASSLMFRTLLIFVSTLTRRRHHQESPQLAAKSRLGLASFPPSQIVRAGEHRMGTSS